MAKKRIGRPKGSKNRKKTPIQWNRLDQDENEVNRTLTPAEEADAALIESGMARKIAGEVPQRREVEAMRRHQKRVEEVDRWRYLKSTTKKQYGIMANRAWITLTKQARMYGIPLTDRDVDLTAVIMWMHEFLTKHHKLLSTVHQASPNATSPSLERYRDERARMAEMERKEREGELMRRDQVHQSFNQIASMLRNAGDILEKSHGADARVILNEAIDDIVAHIKHTFGHASGGGE